MDDRKTILDTYKRPQTFYKKKMSLADATEFNNMVRMLRRFRGMSGSGDNIRLEIQLHHPNKIVNALI